MRYKLLKDTPFSKAGTIIEKSIISEGYPVDGISYSAETLNLKSDWFEIIDDEPEYQIVSPAVRGRGSDLIVDYCFESEEMAKAHLGTNFHSWPLCDAEGNPIKYRIKVKKIKQEPLRGNNALQHKS